MEDVNILQKNLADFRSNRFGYNTWRCR